MKEAYVVREYSQVLLKGSWHSDDCVWDWETKETQFKTKEAARFYFETLSPTDDTPIIRLYFVTYDKYGHIDEDEFLDELS